MISSWMLHARIISEISHQVSLSLDLWHVCHNLDVIETHQLDAAEVTPHINLVAITSHITTRCSWDIHYNYFGVIPLPMPCDAFLSLFVFSFV